MRIQRLDLTRYGHFTDHSLDFKTKDHNACDFHIIFGVNEAGKTTAFEAYLDFLFGFSSRCPYNFLHEYDKMLVAGVVEIGKNSYELERYKRTRNDLLDNQGNPANPTILVQALGGLTRDQYRSMFSLDDVTIEAGGEDILKCRGALGELLFSARAGLSNLGSILEGVRTEMDQFHKPRGRSTELLAAKNTLKQLNSDIKKLDTDAGAYKSLTKKRDAAQSQYEQLKSKLNQLSLEKVHCEAALECIPLLAQLYQILDDLSQVSELPEQPDGLSEEVKSLQERYRLVQFEHDQAQQRILSLQAKLAEITRDPLIVERALSLKQLLQDAKSRAQTASQDLPELQTESSRLEAEIAREYRALGPSVNPPAQIPEPRLLELEKLANIWSTTENELRIAETEQRRAELKLIELESESTSSAIQDPIDDNISEILDNIEPEALLEKHLQASQAITDLKEKLELRVHKLFERPLDILSLPKPNISMKVASKITRTCQKLQADLTTTQGEWDANSRQLVKVEAKIAWIELDKSLVTDSQARTKRELRDEAWQIHFGQMNLDTARSFHKEMESFDIMQESRVSCADRTAQFREFQMSKVELEAQSTRLKSQIINLQSQLDSERAVIIDECKNLGLSCEFEWQEFPQWLQELYSIHEDIEALNKKCQELNRIQADMLKAEATIKQAIPTVAGDAELSELTRFARKSVALVAQNNETAKTRASNRAQAISDINRRGETAAQIRSNLEIVNSNWRTLTSNHPFCPSELIEFRAVLPTYRNLNILLAKSEELNQRIKSMSADYASFEIDIKRFAKLVNANINLDTMVLANLLSTRLTEAESNETLYKSYSDEVNEEQEKLRKANHNLATIQEAVQDKAVYFANHSKIDTIDQLVAIVDQSERAMKLREESRRLKIRITTKLGVTTIEEAQDLLNQATLPDIEAKLEALKNDYEQANNDFTTAIGDLRSAIDDLNRVGGDDDVIRLREKRETHLLALIANAKHHLRLRLGSLVGERALARYRDKYRSSMLSDCSKYFNSLSNGRYSRLLTQPDGETEILLAYREDDKRSIAVSSMSKGTRFQLYLALRVAGYNQFKSGGTALPFIADDFMETFDNIRTKAALKVMQEMSTNCQVLYFTHHEHVVELAENVCGDAVKLHYL